jgi:hypothetical protein
MTESGSGGFRPANGEDDVPSDDRPQVDGVQIMMAVAQTVPDDDLLEGLSVKTLQRMQRAGREAVECQRVLSRAELNLVGECIKHHGTFYEYDHYPPGDVYDDESHAQYYYHTHRGMMGEHGHFHTFLRNKGIAQGIKPVPYEGGEPWPEGDEILSHLVAISMDRHGVAIGLFTTNRWVTDENWFRADDVIRMLDRFVIDHADPSWPVNRWISAMLVLFRPQIEILLQQRDATLNDHLQRFPDADIFEDRELDLMSDVRINIDEQIQAVDKALAERRPAALD